VIALLPIILGGIALFVAAGIVVVAFLPARLSGILLPAAPALGVMALVVTLHATTLVVGVRIGLPVVAALGAAALVLRSRRCRWWRGLDGRGFAVAALVAGLIPFAAVIGPARTYGATLVQPPAHGEFDAFAYTTVTDWLLTHPALERPRQVSTAPVWGYANAHFDLGLGIGQELSAAAVSTVSEHDPADSWYTVTALWLVLLPGVGAAFFSLLGLSRAVGLIGGVLASLTAVVAVQLPDQHSDALLGVVLAPLAIGLIARTLQGHGRPEDAVPPLWLGALALDAMIGVYSEYLPTLALAFAAFVLVRSPRELSVWVRRTTLLVGLSLILCPLAWIDAVRSLRAIAPLGVGTDHSSPFLGVSPLTAVARWAGTTAYYGTDGVAVGVAFAALLTAAAIAAVILSPARRLFACLLGSTAVIVVVLSTPIHFFPYGQARALQITSILVVLVAVAGVATLIERLHRSLHWRGLAVPAVGAALAAALALVVADHATIDSAVLTDASHQHVDATFTEAAQWVGGVGGSSGSNVTVIAPDYFDQLWILYALRDRPGVNYPFLFPEYTHVSKFQFDDGRVRRYVLVDTPLFLDADPSVIVARNARFTLLDLSRGRAVVAVGLSGFSSEGSGASYQQWLGYIGDLVLVQSPSTIHPELRMAANPALGTVPLTLDEIGGSTQHVTTPVAGGTFDVDVGARTVSVFQVISLAGATPRGPTQPSPASVVLTGVAFR
jgi:hypothetical protein